MNTEGARERLNDYLLNGVEAELYWAQEARLMATIIGKHSRRINETRFGVLFGRLQEVFSERETLAISKIFDRPNKRFPTRSIPAILDLVDAESSCWILEDRYVLAELLRSRGLGDFSEEKDEEISRAVTAHFRSTVPSPDKKETCSLSASLHRVLQSRNKVHAHNEAVTVGSRDLPSWKDTEELFQYGRDFVSAIAEGFLGIALIATQPHQTSRLLELLIALANLTTDEFFEDKRNRWTLERLRADLGLEEGNSK
jgi:hypothetical protein